MEEVLLVIYVPESHADGLRNVLGEAKAGIIGEYSFCSFSSKGIGRFKPSEQANPHIGEKNTLEEVVEERIELKVKKNLLSEVLKKVYEVHPYEEPAFHIIPILNNIDFVN